MIKRILIVIIISSFFINCIRESEEQTHCFLFINDSERSILMEQYRINSAGAFLENTFEKSGSGVLSESCRTHFRMPTVTEVYRVDSIIVKFDDSRRLTFTTSLGQNQTTDSIFYVDKWEDDRDNNNFYWRFTEEDFQNAEPF